MAAEINLSQSKDLERFSANMFRVLQSSHINFLIGAGASCPAIQAAGNIEADLTKLFIEGKVVEANLKTVDFVKSFQTTSFEHRWPDLLGESPDTATTKANYVGFIRAIEKVLSERKTTLLPKQAGLFTTNYDTFFEACGDVCPGIMLNDGFHRTPSLSGKHKFQPEHLFNATHQTANHYDYTAEIPCLNVVKLHGSLTWQKDGRDITFGLTDFKAFDDVERDKPDAVEAVLAKLALVLPTQQKYQQTSIERIYYDLLRIFANALERENTLLITFGFSYRDEHLMDILRRALRNPTLLIVACCYNEADLAHAKRQLGQYNNVWLLHVGATGVLDFPRVTRALVQAVAKPEKSHA